MQNVFAPDHSTIPLKLYHCVRQIAHEYLVTIKERDKALSNKKPYAEYINKKEKNRHKESIFRAGKIEMTKVK